jgi:hypothetical protein
MNWIGITSVIKTEQLWSKDVKLIEGFDMPELSSPVKLWKSSNLGMDLQAQYRKSSFSMDNVFILFVFFFFDAKSKKG